MPQVYMSALFFLFQKFVCESQQNWEVPVLISKGDPQQQQKKIYSNKGDSPKKEKRKKKKKRRSMY